VRELFDKLKEAAMSVLPVVLIVIALAITPFVNVGNTEIITFLISTIFLIVGIALFTLGADLAMTPMGNSVGSGLAKQRKLGLLLVISFLLGLLLNYTSNSISCIIFAIVSFISIILVLYYMRGRIGLRPEQYEPKDINNIKI
jgi:Ca2+/H+ antiporter